MRGGEMVLEELRSSTTATASSSSSPAAAAAYSSIYQNYPLISSVIAFAVAQLIKFFTTWWYREKRWDAKQLIASGGMPSSHSSTVTSLAISIGIHEGFGSSLFATAIILAAVVMYDAFGVRLQAGKQAELLNQIVYELPPEHPLSETRPLRELLGHTPLQVTAGCFLGALIAAVAYLIKLFAVGGSGMA